MRVGDGGRSPPARRASTSARARSGTDAMIVLADADLAHAVDGRAVGGRAPAPGQLAGSLKRVYVVAERYEELLEALVPRRRAS